MNINVKVTDGSDEGTGHSIVYLDSLCISQGRLAFKSVVDSKKDLGLFVSMRIWVSRHCDFSTVREFNTEGYLGLLPCPEIDIDAPSWTPEEVRQFMSFLNLTHYTLVRCRAVELNATFLDIFYERGLYAHLMVRSPRDWGEFTRIHRLCLDPTNRINIHSMYYDSCPVAWIWYRHLDHRTILRLMVYACAPDMKWTRGPRPKRDILERVRRMMTTPRTVTFMGQTIETWR